MVILNYNSNGFILEDNDYKFKNDQDHEVVEEKEKKEVPKKKCLKNSLNR